MTTFVAHPSVRIRGTEHTYTPVLCQDETCDGHVKGAHMHCPFCTVAESYQDPVILRAHFRIKHVDKGIDFAGLKVLRCCNRCEMVGTIKGEKKYKGAHWHCYRCRNGFNRRDEAIKHFKTHFRNPHTTFQIQVTQDVNCRQYYSGSVEAHAKAYSGLAVTLSSGGDTNSTLGSTITHSLLASSSDTDTPTLLTVEPREADGQSNGIPLGAEEEVGSSHHVTEQTQTLVLMDHDTSTGSLIYDESTCILTEQGEESLGQTLLQKRLLDLLQQMDTLRQEKESVEKTLRAEITQLKEQVASLAQSNMKLAQELQAFQSADQSQSVTKLMENLQEQHKELLQTHLATLRQTFLSRSAATTLNSHVGTLKLSGDQVQDQDHNEECSGAGAEVQGALGGALSGMELGELKGPLAKFGPLQPDPESLDTALQDATLSTHGEPEVKQRHTPTRKKRSSEDDFGLSSENKVTRVN